ncbi:MAG: iron ABC transporter permease [Lachnospiraceae bacterium]|nr:iron ABC transporter permease [Lachnospiraceae bacterium]
MKKGREGAVFLLLTALLLTAFLLSLGLGSVRIPVSEVLSVLSGGGGEEARSIILQIRMPRAVLAVLVGGALSVSGFMLQTFFANPIAGPYILGISSGARMAVAIVLILLARSLRLISSWLLIGAAFAGAMLATALVFLASSRVRGMAGLLVAGVMIGYIFSAVTEFLVTFASDQDIVNLHGWNQGSLSGADWSGVLAASAAVLAAGFFSFLLSKPMNAYLLGEAYAGSMGVNIRAFRIALVMLSSILSAVAAAFAGPVSFVGIAMPYLAGKSLGTLKPVLVIPASFLSGALFCVSCDLAARMVFAPTEVSISSVTAFFGAPVVLYILFHEKGRGRE